MTEEIIQGMERVNAPKQGQERSRISEAIAAIDTFFSEKNLKQKSRLSSRNIRGITAALATNDYLEEKYGFRIGIMDELVNEKTEHIISLDGKGRDEVIELIKGFASVAEQQEMIDVIRKTRGLN